MISHLTPHAIASDVRMRRTQHKGAFLLVEGASDKTTFRPLIDSTASQIVIAHGWENAQAVAAILEQENFPGVLTVLDADFRRVESVPSPSKNILLTDLHDIECMMAASPALAKLLGEFVQTERLERFEERTGCTIAETLARNSAVIGYLRWVSIRLKLALRFEGLDFNRFVIRDNLQIDQQELIDALKDHSQRHDIDSSWLAREATTMADPRHDPWQVSCGHDLLEILSFAMRHTIAGHDAREVKRDVLERSLRLAYEQAHFERSELARAIYAWEAAHPPYRVLPVR